MRKEKTLLLDEIKDKVKASKGMIITRYEKLEPNLSWKLRDTLGQHGSILEVLKKRVFLKAIEGSVAIDENLLKGHIGVVFVTQDDAMPSAKAVFKFSEENANVLQVVVGQMDGKIVPAAELEALSKLPGLEEMRAIMLGLFTSPMSQLLAVFDAKCAASSENKSE
jgi:large subunit ribosomal protein L10